MNERDMISKCSMNFNLHFKTFLHNVCHIVGRSSKSDDNGLIRGIVYLAIKSYYKFVISMKPIES